MTKPNDDAEAVRTRYFVKPTDLRTKSKLNEYSGVGKSPGQDMAPLIPHNCAPFKFEANFEDRKAGYYCIVWKLKLQPWFRAPWGLHVQAIISYKDDHADSSEWNEWHEIVVHKYLVIHPHHGVANVKLFLRNNEDPEIGNSESPGKGDKKDGIDENYGSFFFSNVAIHPYSKRDLNLEDLDNTPEGLVASSNIRPTDNIPVSRISAAPKVNLIAALHVANDKIHVGIWDYSKIQEIPRDTRHSLAGWEPKTKADIRYKNRIHKPPLGISLSPDGRQLAVFQEPMIGDWGDGTKVKKGDFEFQLIFFDNLAPTSESGESEISGDYVVTIDNLRPVPSVSNPASIIPSLRSFTICSL
ncbi:hypothetical protein BGX26_007375 [Mortierella sp. AD094]|nr:hypothetical protein BGX26_007375 [Mortierella sp. AD094]